MNPWSKALRIAFSNRDIIVGQPIANAIKQFTMCSVCIYHYRGIYAMLKGEKSLAMIKLYQFPFSPFCEKTRWALDYKGLPYQVHNLLPGLHMLTTRQLAEKSSVPILVHGSVVVQDSPVILDYLDLYWGTRMLTPMDALEAKQACEWEGYLDEEIGVPLRLWFYWHVLRDWPRAMHFLLLDTPWHQGLVFRAMFPLLRPAIFRFMGIDDLSSRSALDRFLQALDVLDQQIQTRLFLVGSQFSRADLTA